MSAQMATTKGTKFVWKLENFSHHNRGESIRSPDFNSHKLTWRAHIYPEGCEDCPIKKGIAYKQNEKALVKRNTVALELKSFGKQVFNFTFAVRDAEGFPLYWDENQKKINSIRDLDPPYFGTAPSPKVHFVLEEDILGSRKAEFLPNDTLTLDLFISKKVEDLVAPTEVHAFTQFAPEIVTVKKSFYWRVPGISSFGPGHVEEYQLDFENKTIITAKLSLSDSKTFSLNLSAPPFYGNINCKVFFSDTRGQMKPIGEIQSKIGPEVDYASIYLKVTRSVLLGYRKQFLFNDSLKLHLECEVASKIKFSYLGDEKVKLELDKEI